MAHGVKRIKALLIDPFQQMLFELDSFPPDLAHVHWILDCESAEALALDRERTHYLWVDESGLIRTPFVFPNFTFRRYADGIYPLAGYGLITGSDGPELTDYSIEPDQIRREIRFEVWQSTSSWTLTKNASPGQPTPKPPSHS